jgi:hypothetical protein
MHMAPRVAAWVAWAVWTSNTPQQGIRSKESGIRSALFFGVRGAQPESSNGELGPGCSFLLGSGRVRLTAVTRYSERVLPLTTSCKV